MTDEALIGRCRQAYTQVANPVYRLSLGQRTVLEYILERDGQCAWSFIGTRALLLFHQGMPTINLGTEVMWFDNHEHLYSDPDFLGVLDCVLAELMSLDSNATYSSIAKRYSEIAMYYERVTKQRK